MSKVEIGPDGTPRVVEETVDNQNPFLASEVNIPPASVPPSNPVVVPSNPEQNPHTDGKENDAFSEPNTSVPLTGVPPSMLPPSNRVPSTARLGVETVTSPSPVVGSPIVNDFGGPATAVPLTDEDDKIKEEQITKREIIRDGLASGEIIPDSANTPQPQFKHLTPERQEERKKLVENIEGALREYGGRESDIPYTHAYWSWQNQLRTF